MEIKDRVLESRWLPIDWITLDPDTMNNLALRFALRSAVVLVGDAGQTTVVLKPGTIFFVATDQLGYAAGMEADLLFNKAMEQAASALLAQVYRLRIAAENDDIPF